MACVLRPCSAVAQPVQRTPAELKLRNTDHEQICCNAHHADPESGNHALHSSGSHSLTNCCVTRTMMKKRTMLWAVFITCALYIGCVYMDLYHGLGEYPILIGCNINVISCVAYIITLISPLYSF